MWRQRSRILWLQAGDANTKFFHRKANCRKSSNRLSSLLDGTSTTSSHEGIAERLFSYFSNHFGEPVVARSELNFNLLYEDDPSLLAHLLLPFSEDEVKEAIFSSPAEKALGPDGLPMIFYQRFWNILKEDILGVFDCFHVGSANLSNLNSSWICPIPKKTEPLTARDLRPISLVHSLSKLIRRCWRLGCRGSSTF